MAYQIIIECDNDPYAVGTAGLVLTPNLYDYGAGAGKYFYTSNFLCFGKTASTSLVISFPKSVQTKSSVALTLNDASLLISAVALCWAVAWLFKRTLRAFGRGL